MPTYDPSFKVIMDPDGIQEQLSQNCADLADELQPLGKELDDTKALLKRLAELRETLISNIDKFGFQILVKEEGSTYYKSVLDSTKTESEILESTLKGITAKLDALKFDLILAVNEGNEDEIHNIFKTTLGLEDVDWDNLFEDAIPNFDREIKDLHAKIQDLIKLLNSVNKEIETLPKVAPGATLEDGDTEISPSAPPTDPTGTISIGQDDLIALQELFQQYPTTPFSHNLLALKDIEPPPPGKFIQIIPSPDDVKSLLSLLGMDELPPSTEKLKVQLLAIKDIMRPDAFELFDDGEVDEYDQIRTFLEDTIKSVGNSFKQFSPVHDGFSHDLGILVQQKNALELLKTEFENFFKDPENTPSEELSQAKDLVLTAITETQTYVDSKNNKQKALSAIIEAHKILGLEFSLDSTYRLEDSEPMTEKKEELESSFIDAITKLKKEWDKKCSDIFAPDVITKAVGVFPLWEWAKETFTPLTTSQKSIDDLKLEFETIILNINEHNLPASGKNKIDLLALIGKASVDLRTGISEGIPGLMDKDTAYDGYFNGGLTERLEGLALNPQISTIANIDRTLSALINTTDLQMKYYGDQEKTHTDHKIALCDYFAEKIGPNMLGDNAKQIIKHLYSPSEVDISSLDKELKTDIALFRLMKDFIGKTTDVNPANKYQFYNGSIEEHPDTSKSLPEAFRDAIKAMQDNPLLNNSESLKRFANSLKSEEKETIKQQLLNDIATSENFTKEDKAIYSKALDVLLSDAEKEQLADLINKKIVEIIKNGFPDVGNLDKFIEQLNKSLTHEDVKETTLLASKLFKETKIINAISDQVKFIKEFKFEDKTTVPNLAKLQEVRESLKRPRKDTLLDSSKGELKSEKGERNGIRQQIISKALEIAKNMDDEYNKNSEMSLALDKYKVFVSNYKSRNPLKSVTVCKDSDGKYLFQCTTHGNTKSHLFDINGKKLPDMAIAPIIDSILSIESENVEKRLAETQDKMQSIDNVRNGPGFQEQKGKNEFKNTYYNVTKKTKDGGPKIEPLD